MGTGPCWVGHKPAKSVLVRCEEVALTKAQGHPMSHGSMGPVATHSCQPESVALTLWQQQQASVPSPPTPPRSNRRSWSEHWVTGLPRHDAHSSFSRIFKQQLCARCSSKCWKFHCKQKILLQANVLSDLETSSLTLTGPQFLHPLSGVPGLGAWKARCPTTRWDHRLPGFASPGSEWGQEGTSQGVSSPGF